MNGGSKRGLYSIKNLEKLGYLVGVPSLLAYSGYTLYHKAKSSDKERSDQILKMEAKYLNDPSKVVKLENFKKKIFAIAVLDQLAGTKENSVEEQKELALST